MTIISHILLFCQETANKTLHAVTFYNDAQSSELYK